MKYEIVFYRSGNTAGIQQLTERIFSDLGLSIANARAAGSPEELGSCIADALKKYRLIIAAGSINEYPDSAEKLIAGFLKPTGKKTGSARPQLIRKGDVSAYYIKSGSQMILIVPDSAEKLGELSDELRKTAAMMFSIELTKQGQPDMEKISSGLDKKLADRSRIKVLPEGSSAEKRNQLRQRRLFILFIALLILGVLELGAAAAIFFMNGGTLPPG